MTNKKTFLSVFLCAGVLALHAQHITVTNRTSARPLENVVVETPVENLGIPFGQYMLVSPSGEKLPLEITADIHGNQKAVFPVKTLAPNQTLRFSIEKGSADAYPKRTYAELSHKIGGECVGNRYEGGFSWVKPNFLTVDGNFRDHAYYVKYEGPGWESDMAGFRFYLDQRNGIDAFGKKTPGIVLPAVGTDGYDNYHKPADWGMDNMKVGKSLGLGSIAVWDGTKAVRVEERDSVVCHIPADGKVRSQVMTTYYGWNANGVKCNLQSLITIDAGSRASRMELKVDKAIDNLATGFIKFDDAELILSESSQDEWSYMASFGKQSIDGEAMGFAVFYKTAQLKQLTSDALNRVAVLKPDENGCAEYYFMAAWEHDWQPVKDKEAFLKCIGEVMNRLNHPVAVNIKKNP